VNGLEYLAMQRLRHNMLTCSTILVNTEGCVKIGLSPLPMDRSLLTRLRQRPASAAPLASRTATILHTSKRWATLLCTLCRTTRLQMMKLSKRQT
jgi:hypothetical protein